MAGKIVPKSLLIKQHQREKMAQEITLHQTLSHPYVVKLDSFFEDSNFVYIILELCRRRSLMELHKRRKAITEPETRYGFDSSVSNKFNRINLSESVEFKKKKKTDVLIF